MERIISIDQWEKNLHSRIPKEAVGLTLQETIDAQKEGIRKAIERKWKNLEAERKEKLLSKGAKK